MSAAAHRRSVAAKRHSSEAFYRTEQLRAWEDRRAEHTRLFHTWREPGQAFAPARQLNEHLAPTGADAEVVADQVALHAWCAREALTGFVRFDLPVWQLHGDCGGNALPLNMAKAQTLLEQSMPCRTATTKPPANGLCEA